MRSDISTQCVCPDRCPNLLTAGQVHGPRVHRLVDTVAEAQNLFLPRQLLADRRLDFLGRGRRAEVEQHLHHLRVGAAVERALERADAADDGRVDVGERRRGHAAANVDALSSWSACRTSAQSMARTARASGR